MSKINTMLVVLLIVVLVLYAVYMNIQLGQTVRQYEAMNAEMVQKFAKLNEERVRARQELARQKVSAEEIVVAAPAALVSPVLPVRENFETGQSAPQPAMRERPRRVRTAKQEAQENAARERARKEKAEVEAMLGQVNTEPEPWEVREPHL